MRASGAVTPAEAAELQGICAYGCAAKGVRRWEEFFSAVIAANETRLNSGVPVVPHFAMGWNPEPRIVNPVPWCKYPALSYAPAATREELLAGARELKAWIARNRTRCVPGHLLTFAWNEFEEGAWICPTLGRDGRPDFTLRDAFAEAVKLWREE